MPTAKKKKTTKTTKKTVTAKTHKKTACRTCSKAKGITPKERMHVYIVTALSITTGILLCADAAMLTLA